MVAWSALFGLVHVCVPLAVSRRDRRHGWRGGGPSPANVAGLAGIGGGAMLIGWTVCGHHVAAACTGSYPVRVNAPEYLLIDGPYRYTRNPMHLGGLAMWGGWTVWFGSVRLLGGLCALAVVMDAGVRWEEYALATRFGPQWRAYAERTPRWLVRANSASCSVSRRVSEARALSSPPGARSGA